MRSDLEKTSIKNGLIMSFVALGLLLGLSTKAQYMLKEADKQYELYNYKMAIDLYEQAYQKKNTLQTAIRLAEANALIGNYRQAESWYAIAVKMPGSIADHLLGYAKALINNSKYDEAKIQLLKFRSGNAKFSQTKLEILLQSCDSAVKWMKNPVPFQVQSQMSLNSQQADWGAVRNGEKIIFVSDRNQSPKKIGKPFLKLDGNQMPDQNIYGWTGNPYSRLYQTTTEGNTLDNFPIDIDTDYHIGAASFTADGNEMYFTLTRLPQKLRYNKAGLATIHTEIFYSKKTADGKTWDKPTPFKFNKVSEYSVGDPHISKDGKQLYFVANAPGGKGGTDIYLTRKSASGEWTDPLNLEEVNTEGNERSPFEGEGVFFFSSDGLVGMGGLDIFMATHSLKGPTAPVNLGYPINSAQDDFAFNIDSQGNGFLSSNRLEGLGCDDIYHVAKQQVRTLKLEGKIYNKKTGLPLASAIVSLKTDKGTLLKLQTDSIGYYIFKIDKGIAYELSAEQTNFRRAEINFTTTTTTLTRDIYLIPIEVNQPIRIENIYYSFNRSNIRSDAAVELDKLVKLMNDNPTIWVEIGSHTDSRGNDRYNLWLSQQRANSVVQYLVSRGIAKNRIVGKGYGVTRLVNRCKKGVNCTPTEHQLNRRTEIKITKQ